MSHSAYALTPGENVTVLSGSIGYQTECKNFLVIENEYSGDKFKSNDQLLLIDGTHFTENEDFYNYVSNNRNKTMNFLVKREGQVKEIQAKGNELLNYIIYNKTSGSYSLTCIDSNGIVKGMAHNLSEDPYFSSDDINKFVGKLGTSKVDVARCDLMLGNYSFMDLDKPSNKNIELTAKPNGVDCKCEIPESMQYGKFTVEPKKDTLLGYANILLQTENGPKKYEINILNTTEKDKYFFFKVSDEFLEDTGGIMSGMSGSPIIRQDKLIGAVSMYIQSREYGWGTFAEYL